MPITYLDNPQQSNMQQTNPQQAQPTITYLDNQPQQAQPQVGALQDFGQGFLSGLTEIPRGAINLAHQAFTGNATPVFGDYKAQGTAGNIGGALGNILPMMAAPEIGLGETIASKLGSFAPLAQRVATGAVQGGFLQGSSAANQGQNLGQIAQQTGQGALVGGVLPAGLEVAGSAFRSLAPTLGGIAGINPSDYQKIFKNIDVGGNPVIARAMLNNIPGMSAVDTSGQLVNKAVSDLANKIPVPTSDITQMIEDTQSGLKKANQAGNFNWQSDTIAPEVKKITDYMNGSVNALEPAKNVLAGLDPATLQRARQMNPTLSDEELADFYRAEPTSQTPTHITASDLQDMKTFLDKRVNYDVQSGEDTVRNQALKALAGSFRDRLSQISPELGQANTAFSTNLAGSQFTNLLPQGGGAIQALRGAGALGALAGGAVHSPLALAGLSFSPLAHGIATGGYEAGAGALNALAPWSQQNILRQYLQKVMAGQQ